MYIYTWAPKVCKIVAGPAVLKVLGNYVTYFWGPGIVCVYMYVYMYVNKQVYKDSSVYGYYTC